MAMLQLELGLMQQELTGKLMEAFCWGLRQFCARKYRFALEKQMPVPQMMFVEILIPTVALNGGLTQEGFALFLPASPQ